MEWERVDRYAERMRTLNIYEDFGGPSLSLRAWQELSAIRPTDLLPNLQSLEWLSVTDTFRYINLFLSPHLTSLNVRVIPGIPNVGPILASLPVKTLGELRFLDHSGDRAVQDVISQLVLKTTAALRSIQVSSDLSDAAFRHIARLPHLSDASVNFVSLGRLSSSSDVAFPSLRTLETRVDSAGGWKYFLGNTKNVYSTVLHSRIALEQEEIVNVFRFLIDKGFHQTIHELSFAVSQPYNLTPQVLTPLLGFKSLTRLSVTSSCDPARCNSRLTKEALALLAEALPRLVELFLGGAQCRSPTREVTLTDLSPLSAHCVHLETLQIHFSAVDIQTDVPDDVLSSSSEQEPPSPNHSRLFQLVVGALPVSTSEKSLLIVAYLLLQMFPKLSMLRWTVENSRWKKVQEHIDTFQKYRLKKQSTRREVATCLFSLVYSRN